MRSRIIGFELGFPDAWHPVPKEVPDLAEWAVSTATRLVSEAVPDASSATAEDATGVLVEQLNDVVKSVRDTGISSLRTAVLIRHPETGVVDAMLTVGAQRGITSAAFAAELEEVVETSENHEFAYAGPIEGTTTAGPVAGMHAMIAHPGEYGEDGSAVLEERVVVGVFPEGTADMVEVTAVARGVGTFDDMPQQIVDLLAGLTVEVEEL
jgi:hypothetical protein